MSEEEFSNWMPTGIVGLGECGTTDYLNSLAYKFPEARAISSQGKITFKN